MKSDTELRLPSAPSAPTAPCADEDTPAAPATGPDEQDRTGSWFQTSWSAYRSLPLFDLA